MADSIQLIDSLKAQLTQVKDRYSQGGITNVVKSALADNQAVLQQWYDRVLDQKGILSEDEKKKLEDDLSAVKKKTDLESSARSTKIIMIVILSGVIILTGTLIYFAKHKKTHA